MSTKMTIWGFGKFRNEILREGNVHRALESLVALGCRGGVLCDDASHDGTTDVLAEFVCERSERGEPWFFIRWSREEQAFEREMEVKQVMMHELHAMAREKGAPDWIFWIDGDETIDEPDLLRQELGHHTFSPLRQRDHDVQGMLMHYTQLWRSERWARTDQGFDDGWFCKAWRYRPDLSFDTTPGTHRSQFPRQIDFSKCARSSVDVIHWGNYGKNLVWKGIQYAGGLGGVDRHVAFGHTPAESLATGEGFDRPEWSSPHPTYRKVGKKAAHPLEAWQRTMPQDDHPRPFTLDEIRRIREMGDLRKRPETFAVVVPAFNRARDLPRALDSLIAQTYERWIALVLDDGSTDDTPEIMRRYQDLDPRIFYARYPTNRGGVAMNEIGMSLACEMTSWWSRLGSDDFFGPSKLALDAEALRKHDACYGLYVVHRPAPADGKPEGFGEICNPPMKGDEIRQGLLAGRYFVSWANVAARCSALEKVRERFGNFVDPRLRNMEDFNFNARMAALGLEFTWRGPEGVDGTPLPLGKAWNSALPSPELEAVWTRAPEGGASSPDHAARMAADQALTLELIKDLSR